MEIVKTSENFKLLEDNHLKGNVPEMVNSQIRFFGSGNILYCEDGVKLVDSSIEFYGNNAVCILKKSKHNYLLSVSLYHNSVIHIGRNNYFNQILQGIASEQKHIFIGNNCLFSVDVVLRTADPHLVYSVEDGKRINSSKSIFIGDSVWVGQHVFLLKGCKIHSGSIIGAGSVVANKKIPSNCSVGGNPCKIIKEDVFWDGRCTHAYLDEQVRRVSTSYCEEKIFSYNKQEYISYEHVEDVMSVINTAEKKLENLLKVSEAKNRFAWSVKNNENGEESQQEELELRCKEAMNILLTPSRKYFKYVYVLLKSLFVNHFNHTFNVFINVKDISREDMHELQEFCNMEGNNSNVYCLSNNKQTDATFKVSSARPQEVYFKLYALDVLPEAVDRILYLDIDTIINGELLELYNLQFAEGECIAACGGARFSGASEYDVSKAIKGQYFNSGVILFNLKEIRKQNITINSYINVAKNNSYWYDQGLLNAIFCDKAKYVPTQLYNYRYGIFHNSKTVNYMQSRIIHFSSWRAPYKPWDLYFESDELQEIGTFKQEEFSISSTLNEMFSIWWKYASMLEDKHYLSFMQELNSKKEWYLRSLNYYFDTNNNLIAKIKLDNEKLSKKTSELSEKLKLAKEWNDAFFKKKVSLALLGSCFSRACMMGQPYFNDNYRDYVNLDYIFYHSSYVSLMANVIDYDTQNMKTRNVDFQRSFDTWAATEFNKTFFEEIACRQPEYLIIDNYADAMCDIVETSEHSYFTLNYFICSANVLNDFSNGRIIRYDSPEKWELLTKAIHKFYTKIFKYVPEERIILVKGRFSEWRIKDNKTILWDNIDEIRQKNQLWEKIDNYILEHYAKIRVVDMTNTGYVSADDFPLGNSSSHYESGFYKEEFYKLNQVFMEDVKGMQEKHE